MKKNILDYTSLTKYDAQDISDAIENSTRSELIAFLEWNDSNGDYRDEVREKDGAKPLTDVEIALTVMRVMWDNQTI